MDEPIIKIKQVNKSYTSHQSVLSNITFDVFPGDFVAIGGVSGCGKSTLLNILGLFDTDYTGDVLILGHNLKTLSPSQRDAFRQHHLGYIFQDFKLLDRYTVYHNLELPLIAKKVSRTVRKRLIEDVLHQVNLEPKILHQYPTTLSGGQMQRVAVARTLLLNPTIILADEPTASLDLKNRDMLISTLKNLNKTLILVSHDTQVCEEASIYYEMKEGLLHEVIRPL